MTVFVATIRGTVTGRYKVRVETQSGDCIGQALDSSQATAERKALRQARRWGDDRGWGPFIVKRKESP